MIVSRAPVRFSLGGGGTDLPSYSREHGGFLVAASIDKYVSVVIARRFYNNIRLAYSKLEVAESVDQIDHRIFKEALRFANIEGGLELHSLADVPANSGLGSSSSFTVALLNGLHAFKREYVPTPQLAEEACHIEIDLLKNKLRNIPNQHVVDSIIESYLKRRVQVEQILQDINYEKFQELEPSLPPELVNIYTYHNDIT